MLRSVVRFHLAPRQNPRSEAVFRPPPRGPRRLRSRGGPELGTLVPSAGIGTGVNALLRPQDVAETLAVSRVTVYRLARAGELASVRIRGQVRFRPEAVEEYLARAETLGPRPVAISHAGEPRPSRTGAGSGYAPQRRPPATSLGHHRRRFQHAQGSTPDTPSRTTGQVKF